MNAILEKFDEDLPSLFEVNEPDLFRDVNEMGKET